MGSRLQRGIARSEREDMLPEMERPTRLLLIRHAESAPTPRISESEWPLSAAGVQQANDLASTLQTRNVDAVYSSPYRRAIATVEPFAAARGLKITLDEDLRERQLTVGFHPQWRRVIEKAWGDLSFALPGCESGLECQARLRRCLERVANQNSGRTVAVASHGNAIALFLTSLDNTFGYAGWQAMKNPDIFLVEYVDGKPRWVRDLPGRTA